MQVRGHPLIAQARHTLPPAWRVGRWVVAVTAMTATMVGARRATAQAVSIARRDSVLVTHDLDGDGHMDYVVREVRSTTYGGLETRIAVYLDQTLHARRPNWATRWADDNEGEYHLDDSLSLTTHVGLLNVAFYGGDGDDHTVLLVRNGRAHVDIVHQIDYGQGYLTVRREGSEVFIDASVEHLALRRVEVPASAPCGPSQWAMMRLRYDRTERRFVQGPRFCVKVQ